MFQNKFVSLAAGLLILSELFVLRAAAFATQTRISHNSHLKNVQDRMQIPFTTTPALHTTSITRSPIIMHKVTRSLSQLKLSTHSTDASSSESDDIINEAPKSTLFKISQWAKGLFQKKEDDNLTFKQKLGKMGLSVLLSYGFVSNMSYCVTVTLAWYGFCKTTQLSPLAPGQWKKFLAVYAGFYVFNNVIRPLRLALSAYVATYFDKAIAFMQRKTNCSKGVAIGLIVFIANIVGTTSLMCLGISLASAASGVPIFMK